jgi:hypothetical protein
MEEMMRLTIVSAILIVSATIVLFPAAAITETLRGCFTRTYSKTHLAQHPDQVVTTVKLRIYQAPSDTNTSWFSIWIQRRGEYKALHSEGICGQKGSMTSCFVECDGGGIRVAPRSQSTVLMKLGVQQPPFGPNGELIKQDERIRMTPCGSWDNDDGSGIEVTGGKDDHEFLLDRVDDAICRGMPASVPKMSSDGNSKPTK